MKKLALSDDILLNIDKPARYIGNEINAVKKDTEKADIRFVLCFPDVYEIGMSYLGIQILYDMFNRRDDTYCERVYSPWIDLDAILREKHIPLFALESQDPVREFDFLGITIQYEMCYTNILQILDLSQIPVLSADRGEDDPIVIGGGPCVYNPEPLADFFDIFYIGEGETVYGHLLDTYKEHQRSGKDRQSFLEMAAAIPGLYVPGFYKVAYNDDGTLKTFIKTNKYAAAKIKRQVAGNLRAAPYPEKPLVPFIKVTQDRVVLEIQRGCIRGCRFCQAGMVYRPNRERDIEDLKEYAIKMLMATGHEEISLSSLSSSDYTELEALIQFLLDEAKSKHVNISLPSLRVDAFSLEVMGKVQDIRKSSLTFAPEAGSQRLRDVINKGLTEEDILDGVSQAFNGGWNRVKLYFMLGLPGEAAKDIEEIAELSNQIAALYYTIPKDKRPGGGRAEIVTSTSFFVPKPFTPFQWVRQNRNEEFLDKQRFLNQKIKAQLNRKSIKYNWHDAELTQLEGVMARGDRRVGKVLLDAYKSGCIYDSWTEHFKYDLWMAAFKKNKIDPLFYTDRERSFDELLPWDFIDVGITKEFLMLEFKKAKEALTTPNCRLKCSGCGCISYKGGICYESQNKIC